MSWSECDIDSEECRGSRIFLRSLRLRIMQNVQSQGRQKVQSHEWPTPVLSEPFKFQLAKLSCTYYRNCRCPCHGCGGFIELYLPLQSPRPHNIGIPKVS